MAGKVIEKTLSNGDKLSYNSKSKRVIVTRKNGRSYTIASYNNSNSGYRRGGFTVGDINNFHLPKRTTAYVLKFFYPSDSLKYLEKYGYIAS